MAHIEVDEILSKLTPDEKLSLLAGRDNWHTNAIPRLGLPSLRTSDGPNGVRGTANFNGTPAACLPCGTGLASTWDVELLHEAGVLMGEEAKAKGAHILLGPCINMQRSPLGGRGFESLAEDPVLSGLGAGALINGIQATGVQATIKHFVCNDQEHERNAYSAQVTERALREIYLSPFQIAIRDSKPTCLMTAYNKVNGEHVSESRRLLHGILRDEWSWKGLVMSDWFGTYSSPNPVSAGLALEMPGPARYHNSELLTLALAAGRLDQFTIDERVGEVLTLIDQCAASGVAENAPEETRDIPETAALLRRLATDAIVLLKNEQLVLPLSKSKTVAVIGPNAKFAAYCGGGSSSLPPYYAITPFDGICSKMPPENVTYALGSHAHKELPLLGDQLRTASGRTGVSFKAYKDPPSTPHREVMDEIQLTNTNMWFADYHCPPMTNNLWYADVEGYFTPDETAEYEFGLCVYGTAKLYIDGVMIVDNETVQKQGTAFYGCGTLEETASLHMQKGKSYQVKVEFASAPASKLGEGGIVRFGGGGVRIGGARKIDPNVEIARAISIARAADQVVLCTGLNSDWEGEGADRENMDLPGYMNQLISAVLDANSRTVVVMQSGTPVEMPWLPSASAVLQAWYGGNEAGNSIADILFGDAVPSGKLPLSFPIKVQDNPAYLNYKSNRGRTLYGEDVYVGYRFYEATSKHVSFPFGHGLSYTTFSFQNLKVQQTDKEVIASLDVTNTGPVTGSEVAQMYIAQQSPSVSRPPKELKGFTKVKLQPGETKRITITALTRYATSFWDEGRSMWISEKDKYRVIVSNSSACDAEEQVVQSEFQIKKTTWWKGL